MYNEDPVTGQRIYTLKKVLDGVVTNVVAFGAFVDVGVHQDGLVHVSQLADRYVADPNAAVRVGQRVRVTVTGVDLERGRIALSMRSKPDVPGAAAGAPAAAPPKGGREKRVNATVQVPSFVPKPGAVAPNGIRFR